MRVFSLMAACLVTACMDAAEPAILERVDVDRVWAGHPVKFALLTHGERQFVAYYDAHRDMRVAWRTLGATPWEYAALPEKVAWDSHNSITMAADAIGCLHLSGNMHAVPLVYFRTRVPLDPSSFERAPMIGESEDRVTYPVFFKGMADALIFTYRDGRSGSGDQIFNGYDTVNKQWNRLLDKPLTAGMGKMNAYFDGPHRGPDGRFHLCWVWRDSPDCASNHDPCYARSPDLIHWETSEGKPLALPIRIDTAEVIDRISAGGGIINGNVRIGFDSSKRAVVSYIKYDANGYTQVYNARFERGAWQVCQASDWEYRWNFSGGGSIPFEIGVARVSPYGAGRLLQEYRHVKYGSGAWLLDESTLKPIGPVARAREIPAELGKPLGEFPGLTVQFAHDLGSSGEEKTRYMLRWETLEANRDRPRTGGLPPASVLSVIKLGDAE